VTASELEAILEHLETLSPSSRASVKRQLLAGARERILALRQRGHSWRSLARELSSAIGESVSADLLRAACLKRAPQRPMRRAASALTAPAEKKVVLPTPAPAASGERFGVKGLKL